MYTIYYVNISTTFTFKYTISINQSIIIFVCLHIRLCICVSIRSCGSAERREIIEASRHRIRRGVHVLAESGHRDGVAGARCTGLRVAAYVEVMATERTHVWRAHGTE